MVGSLPIPMPPQEIHPTNAELNAVLENSGVSKTVYALVMPETEAALAFVVDGSDRSRILSDHEGSPAALLSVLDKLREERYLSQFREAWTQKQDEIHWKFFDKWEKWSSPSVSARWSEYAHRYPTAGASEALRERISAYGHRARSEGFRPKIHAFEGDYEGYEAYARASFVEFERHPRSLWDGIPARLGERDLFCISAPSALDGNVWGEYDEFMKLLWRRRPRAGVVLDLTYVGCVASHFSVRADYPNIESVIFSLSKPMGVYYHRVGGCLTREPSPGLFGNKWFKNLTSLALGTELMERHHVHALPMKYKKAQLDAMVMASSALSVDVHPSDVFLLCHAPMPPNPSPLQRYLRRPDGTPSGILRACLTPTMAAIINPSADSRVKARGHEGAVS